MSELTRGASEPRAAAQAQAKPRAPFSAWLGLVILLLLYLFSLLDKQIFALLALPLGTALKLTDVQFALLLGVGFSLLYAVGTLASGWLVDRYSRQLILFVGVAFWSLSGAASGFAGAFGSLFLARACVGLGESVLAPAANSLIASLFPRERIGLAVGIYYMGANLGGVIALVFGGAAISFLTAHGGMTVPGIGHFAPWQAAFIVTGLPGLIAAVLALAIRAPARAPTAAKAERASDAKDFIVFVKSHGALVGHQIGIVTLLTLISYALIYWSAAYTGRTFHWSSAKIGVVLATGIAAGGAGNVLWGALTDEVRKRGSQDGVYRVFFWATLIGIPITAATFLSRNPMIFTVGYPLTYVTISSFGALISTIQLGTPAKFHGRLVALQTFAVAIVALGLGPLVVAFITEHVLGDKSKVGESIVITVTACGLAACLLMVLGRKPLRAAMSEQEAATETATAVFVEDVVEAPL